MHPFILEKRAEIEELCRRYHVARLELFGSALGERFDPLTSDVDLTVQFKPLDPVSYDDAYFGLLEELERIFGRRVDLVSAKSIENPYFRKSVESTKQLLYAA